MNDKILIPLSENTLGPICHIGGIIVPAMAYGFAFGFIILSFI